MKPAANRLSQQECAQCSCRKSKAEHWDTVAMISFAKLDKALCFPFVNSRIAFLGSTAKPASHRQPELRNSCQHVSQPQTQKHCYTKSDRRQTYNRLAKRSRRKRASTTDVAAGEGHVTQWHVEAAQQRGVWQLEVHWPQWAHSHRPGGHAAGDPSFAAAQAAPARFDHGPRS